MRERPPVVIFSGCEVTSSQGQLLSSPDGAGVDWGRLLELFAQLAAAQ